GLAATLSHPMGEGLGVRGLLRVGSWPQFACMSRWKLPMNLPHLVGADVRRLTSFAAHPEKIARLPRTRRRTRTRTRRIGLWPQCASAIRRSGLSMNLTLGNSKHLAFSPLTPALSPLRGEGAGSRPRCASKVGGVTHKL